MAILITKVTIEIMRSKPVVEMGDENTIKIDV